jgi:hypothetical protein
MAHRTGKTDLQGDEWGTQRSYGDGEESGATEVFQRVGFNACNTLN